MNKSSSMQTVGDILTKFNPLEDKYISREFQSYGCYLAEELNDYKHKSLYIKLAKTVPRALLEKALSYVKDADVKRKGALFMWKLKEMGAWNNKIKDSRRKVGIHDAVMRKNLQTASGQKSKIKNKKKVEDIPF